MNLNRALSLAVFAGFTSFVSMVGSLTAQTYPSKPIRVVVPVTPGPLDTLARLLSERMQEQFRQPFIIENRPGAGGNIGAELVAKSSPDAYTLLYAIDTTFTVNPSLYRKSNFDYEKDFSPVTLIGEFGLVLAVNPQFPANNLQDFIELGKRRALSYGSSGNGSPAHLAFAYFQNVAGIKGNHVPYKGATQSVTDLLAGQIRPLWSCLPWHRIYALANYADWACRWPHAHHSCQRSRRSRSWAFPASMLALDFS
jgi:tripartite-type tricarboxylate transporter receptor subunit TctC